MRDRTPTGSATGSRPKTRTEPLSARSRPENVLDERRLARAVCADEAVDRAARQRQAHRGQGGLGAEAARQLRHGDDGLGHARSIILPSGDAGAGTATDRRQRSRQRRDRNQPHHQFAEVARDRIRRPHDARRPAPLRHQRRGLARRSRSYDRSARSTSASPRASCRASRRRRSPAPRPGRCAAAPGAPRPPAASPRPCPRTESDRGRPARRSAGLRWPTSPRETSHRTGAT